MSVETTWGGLGDAVHVCVRGQLDAAEVDDIECLLASAGGAAIVLDFRDAQSFRPTALARLARDLSGGAGRVALRGLSEYHYRLLRYVEALPLGAGGAPEE